MNPKYPVYIISKGRWESRKTSKTLERMNIPYHIVVEEQEYDQYAQVIDPNKILILPIKYQNEYNTCDTENIKTVGSGAARNFCWDHSISLGFERHWLMDDNITNFFRFNHNLTIPVTSGTIFRVAEDFVDRYENIALAGFQYDFFVSRKEIHPPFLLNTRIYSCILILNNLSYRWRSRYNEDTDLSLRVLKDGWCTVLFNAFLQEKATTMTLKGGNTESLYFIEEGRLKMAQALVNLHPDVAKITWKWGRWQHQVDYSHFKRNKLIKKLGVIIPEGNDEYGMVLRTYPSKKHIPKTYQ
jgi:hypothetical protein